MSDPEPEPDDGPKRWLNENVPLFVLGVIRAEIASRVEHRQRILARGALEGAVVEGLPDEGRVRRAGVDHDRVLAAGDHEHDHREPLVLAPASLVSDRGLVRLGYEARRQCQNLQTHCFPALYRDLLPAR